LVTLRIESSLYFDLRGGNCHISLNRR